MTRLMPGTKIRMMDGKEATILERIGVGGQGQVYKAEFRDRVYALKIFNKGDGLRDQLEQILELDLDEDLFELPLIMTARSEKRFGYLMNLRSEDFKPMASWFRGRRKFSSLMAQVNAAIGIACGLKKVHQKGLCFPGFDYNNIRINFSTGEILLCDLDELNFVGKETMSLGNLRNLAPELSIKGYKPDVTSDRYNLALILFRLFFIDHPLEGPHTLCECMTKESERKAYAEDPVYIMDPRDLRNRPTRGIALNVKSLWDRYPAYLKDAFEKSFSKESLHERKGRLTEMEWLDILLRLRGDIIRCPRCNEEMFSSGKGKNHCPFCKEKFNVSYELCFKNESIPLYSGATLLKGHLDKAAGNKLEVIGTVVSNKIRPGLIGLKNISKETWMIILEDGSKRFVGKDGVVPIIKGIKQILFSKSETESGHIKN